MSSEQPIWCAKCNLRIAPADRRTVYQRTDYHGHCFLQLVREEADEQMRIKRGPDLVRTDGQKASASLR